MRTRNKQGILKILSLVTFFWATNSLAENPPEPPKPVAENQQVGELIASCMESNKAVRSQIQAFAMNGAAIVKFGLEIVKANPGLGLPPNSAGVSSLLNVVMPRQSTPKRGPVAVRDHALKEAKYGEDIKSAKDCFDLYKAGLAYESSGVNLACQLAEILGQDSAFPICNSPIAESI